AFRSAMWCTALNCSTLGGTLPIDAQPSLYWVSIQVSIAPFSPQAYSNALKKSTFPMCCPQKEKPPRPAAGIAVAVRSDPARHHAHAEPEKSLVAEAKRFFRRSGQNLHAHAGRQRNPAVGVDHQRIIGAGNLADPD